MLHGTSPLNRVQQKMLMFCLVSWAKQAATIPLTTTIHHFHNRDPWVCYATDGCCKYHITSHLSLSAFLTRRATSVQQENELYLASRDVRAAHGTSRSSPKMDMRRPREDLRPFMKRLGRQEYPVVCLLFWISRL